MRFHSLTKCIWAMPSAPRKQQTYFSAWPQRPQDLHQSRAPKSPRQRHAFSQRLKTHLAMHSAPRQQTCSSPKAPRAPRAPNGHSAFFTASNTHLSHAHPVQGTKGPKTATCVFPDSQNAFKPIPSAPRQQTCNPRLHGPQTATYVFTASQNAFKPCPVHHEGRPTATQGSKGPNQPPAFFTASQNALKPCPPSAVIQGPKQPHAFSQPPKTHLNKPCPPTKGPKTATCVFPHSQKAFGHAQCATTADLQ